MSTEAGPLHMLVRALGRLVALDEADAAALLSLPFRPLRLPPLGYVVREGDRPCEIGLLTSGFAFRHRILGDGGRQILSLHLPGDLLDAQSGLFEASDYNVQALTPAELAMVPAETLRARMAERPRLAEAMLKAMMIEASISREWIANVGRRNARARLAHLLCEQVARMRQAGFARDGAYELPMTQEQLADCTGLTSVHVNRMLKQLETDGLIVRIRRAIRVPRWEELCRAADFDPRYLHLEANVVAA